MSKVKTVTLEIPDDSKLCDVLLSAEAAEALLERAIEAIEDGEPIFVSHPTPHPGDLDGRDQPDSATRH